MAVLILGFAKMNDETDSSKESQVGNSQIEFFEDKVSELIGRKQLVDGDTSKYNVEIKSARIAKNHANEDCVVITYVFENNGDEEIGFMTAMDVNVYQNGVALSGTVCSNESDFQFRAYNRNKVKPGTEYEFNIGYLFNDSTSDIVVEAKNNYAEDPELFITRTFEF